MQSVLLTTKEAAAALRVSAISLHRWRSQGKGPKFIELGRKIYYRPGDIDAYLDELSEKSAERMQQELPKAA